MKCVGMANNDHESFFLKSQWKRTTPQRLHRSILAQHGESLLSDQNDPGMSETGRNELGN